ncbi:hypothetical protein G3N94_24690 [Burkholderia sp. Ac-20353]|nr:hypothetical protein [Burkholderia sp. Ac-20353]
MPKFAKAQQHALDDLLSHFTPVQLVRAHNAALDGVRCVDHKLAKHMATTTVWAFDLPGHPSDRPGFRRGASVTGSMDRCHAERSLRQKIG